MGLRFKGLHFRGRRFRGKGKSTSVEQKTKLIPSFSIVFVFEVFIFEVFAFEVFVFEVFVSEVLGLRSSFSILPCEV